MRNILKLVVLFTTLSTASPAHAIQRQRAMNWCWAAVIQDVLAQGGVSREQVQIAADLDGWPQDRPAYIGEVMALLRGYGFVAGTYMRPGTVQELYGTLTRGYSIIALVSPNGGAVGHYILIHGFNPNTGALAVSEPYTGMSYWESPQNLYMRWVWRGSVVVGRR